MKRGIERVGRRAVIERERRISKEHVRDLFPLFWGVKVMGMGGCENAILGFGSTWIPQATERIFGRWPTVGCLADGKIRPNRP